MGMSEHNKQQSLFGV